jgi:membrane associated rhomboid family serine protease
MFPLYDNLPTTRRPVITLAVIVINVLAFLCLLSQGEQQRELAVAQHGFVPKRIEQLRDPNLIVPVKVGEVRRPQLGGLVVVAQPLVVQLPAQPSAIYASVLTAMFLHGGWLHLLGNMWFLWIFGNNIEDHLGHFGFVCFYLLGGLLATACHWAYNPASTTPVIGASGAIAAVLGAYAITYPFARVHTLIFLIVFITTVDLPALLVLGIWFLGQVLEGSRALQIGGINGGEVGVAWWAHVGGFLAGMVLMPLLSAMAPSPPSPEPQWRDPFEPDSQSRL